jgi:polyribonucleotide nucleotidyltransferase
LVVAGTKEAVMMVESEAYELSETEMLGAVKFGHEKLQPVIDLIIDLAEDAAKEPMDFSEPDYKEIYSDVEKVGKKIMTKAFSFTDKQQRTTAVSDARSMIIDQLTEENQTILY